MVSLSFYGFFQKHSAPKPEVTFKGKLLVQEFSGFYALRQHRNTQHVMQIGSGTRDVNLYHILEDVEDHSLRDELRSCQHFLLDSDLERARHKVFNHSVETLKKKTIVNEKLDHFFNNLKCAAKVNLAFGFILENKEAGGFRYLYAQKNTLLNRSKLVCTYDDLAIETDVIESCSRERMNTK